MLNIMEASPFLLIMIFNRLFFRLIIAGTKGLVKADSGSLLKSRDNRTIGIKGYLYAQSI